MWSSTDLGSGTEFPDGAGKILDFNKYVHWSDHLLVIQKVGQEVNYLSSCFASTAAGKIWEVCFVFRVHKQSFKTQMLTVIPKESPAFATEHTHYFTQEAIIVNETCNNASNFADLLIVQSTSSQSKTTPTQPIPLRQSEKPGHLASLLK